MVLDRILHENRSEETLFTGGGCSIITVEDIPFRCNSVFNAGAAIHNGEYVLMLRVEDLKGRSVFALARSYDGFHFTIDPHPVMEPSDVEPFRTYEQRGIEDPRITEIDGVYHIMYTAYPDTARALPSRQRPTLGVSPALELYQSLKTRTGCSFPGKSAEDMQDWTVLMQGWETWRLLY